MIRMKKRITSRIDQMFKELDEEMADEDTGGGGCADIFIRGREYTVFDGMRDPGPYVYLCDADGDLIDSTKTRFTDRSELRAHLIRIYKGECE